MADYSDPKRGTAYRFTLSLFARSNNQIKTAPTLAAGDVKVSKDNGATANITTLPTEAPASSGILQVDLSATEMTADLVTVTFIDAAGAEWNDVSVHIAPTVRQLGDLAYPATSGRSMVVDAAGLVDANTVKVGPSGSGTAQTAGDIPARLPAALVSGRMDSSVGAMAADTLTASALAASAVTEIQTGLASSTDLATVASYIDTEVAAIKAKTDNLPPDPADQSALEALINAISAPTANQNADALLDRVDGVETGFTVREVLRLCAAVLGGKASGMGTTTALFRDLNDSKNRVEATVDGDGNRSTVVLDVS